MRPYIDLQRRFAGLRIAMWLAIGMLIAGIAITTQAHAQTSNNNTYPQNAVAVASGATGTTGATTATLGAAAGSTTYICSFQVTASATGASNNLVTVGGVQGTPGNGVNLFYQFTAGATPSNGQLVVNFTPCIPSPTQNTTITVTLAAVGVGGVTAVAATGYQLPNL